MSIQNHRAVINEATSTSAPSQLQSTELGDAYQETRRFLSLTSCISRSEGAQRLCGECNATKEHNEQVHNVADDHFHLHPSLVGPHAVDDCAYAKRQQQHGGEGEEKVSLCPFTR